MKVTILKNKQMIRVWMYVVIAQILLLSNCSPQGLDLPDSINTAPPARELEPLPTTPQDSLPQQETPRDSLVIPKG